MRAYMVPEFGASGTIGERPVPEPAEGQILVRVRAAGVNAMDAIMVMGVYKDFMEHRLPLTPGLDYAGTVEAIGPEVEGIAVGDEVFGNVGKMYLGEGSFAEHVTATAALATRRPDGLSVVQAAALPLAGGTALAAVDAAGIGPGDPIVIVGAAGGVGGFATQLAARRGARVIAVTSPANLDHVRSLGAEDVIDRTAGDVAEHVRQRIPDGVAALIDNFHDAQGLVSLASVVRPGGRIISPIAQGGDQVLAGLPLTFHLVQAAVGRAGELGDLVTRGALTVTVESLPLAQAADAISRQATRQVRGKLVLVVE